MKTIYSEKIVRIIKARKKLEELLKVKIIFKGKKIEISGSAENEYIAEKVIEAINMGFPIKEAIKIKTEEKEFDVLKIKNYTKRKDLRTIRARIIGKRGKALKTFSQLTECCFELKNNEVGIIGDPENIENAIEGIVSIIKGTHHSHVYKGLEKHKPQPISDFGLKDKGQQ